jgi:hypothetical protein
MDVRECVVLLYVVVGVCVYDWSHEIEYRSIVCDRLDKDERTNKGNKGRFQHAGHIVVRDGMAWHDGRKVWKGTIPHDSVME